MCKVAKYTMHVLPDQTQTHRRLMKSCCLDAYVQIQQQSSGRSAGPAHATAVGIISGGCCTVQRQLQYTIQRAMRLRHSVLLLVIGSSRHQPALRFAQGRLAHAEGSLGEFYSSVVQQFRCLPGGLSEQPEYRCRCQRSMMVWYLPT